MKINPNDYSSSKARTSALNTLWEFGNELKVYLKRVLYALERACMQRDYFIGTQIYQDETLPVVEDGYHGYASYESDMPNPSWPIAGTKSVAGIVSKVVAGTRYQVGGEWSEEYQITDPLVGDHADAVYSNSTTIALRYYANSEYTGDYSVGTLQPTLTNNAVALYTPVAPNGFDANPAYLWAYPNQIPRNAVFLEAGSALGSNPVSLQQVFTNSTTGPATAWFGYYDDAAAGADSITIPLPIKPGITASDYSAKILIYEAQNNSYTPVENIANAYQYQATYTPLPTALTFTKNDLNALVNIEHPFIIQIHHLTTV